MTAIPSWGKISISIAKKGKNALVIPHGKNPRVASTVTKDAGNKTGISFPLVCDKEIHQQELKAKVLY